MAVNQTPRDRFSSAARVAGAGFAACAAAAVGLVVGTILAGLDDFSTTVRALGYASFFVWLCAAGFFAFSAIRALEYAWLGQTLLRLGFWTAAVAAGLFAGAAGAQIFAGPSASRAASLMVEWTVDRPRIDANGRPLGEARVPVHFVAEGPNGHACPTQGVYTWKIASSNTGAGSGAARDPRGCRVIEWLRPGRTFEADVYEVGPNGSHARGALVGHIRSLLIVSIGDSVAAGEGNPRPARKRRRWVDRKCHRSFYAAPRIVADLIQSDHPHALVTLVHAACTGAWIDGLGAPAFLDDRPSLLTNAIHKGGEVAAVDALLNRRHPDAILLTVGANDLGFSNLVVHCFLNKKCQEQDLHGWEPTKLVEDRREALKGSFARLAKEPLLTESRRVYLTEYFDPLQDSPGHYCTIWALKPLLVIRPDEAEWAEEHVIVPLNELLQNVARTNHWTYVGGIQSEFQYHGYCAEPPERRWVVRVWSSIAHGNRMGSLHPNQAGQRFYAERIVHYVEPNLGSAG